MNWLLILGMAALVGICLGVFGSGGSILAVPILTYIFGYPLKSSVAMSLIIVGITALISTILQWRQKALCYQAALFFSVVGILGTVAGTWVGERLSVITQLILFGLLMILVATIMLLQKEKDSVVTENECHLRAQLVGSLGISVGFMTGLLGVGGGFLIVPALNSLGRLKLRLAIGTSLFIITINSAAGVVGYWGKVFFDWPFILIFTLISSLSSFLGSALSYRLPIKKLKKAFAGFLLLLGTWIIVKNIFNF